MNQVLFNNVLGGIFSDDNLFALDTTAADQDSYFTVPSVGNLTLGLDENDNLLKGAIAQLGEGASLQFAQIVAPYNINIALSGTVTEILSTGGFADASVSSIWVCLCPEPTAAFLLGNAMIGFAAGRRS